MRRTFSTSGSASRTGHAAFALRYDSFMSLLRTLALLLTAGALLDGAIAADAPGSSPAASPAQATTSRAVMTGEQVVRILDETVDWYRTLGAQQQSATQPSDLLILYANRQIADRAIGLAFEIARANAELLSSEADAAPTASSPLSSGSDNGSGRLGIWDQAANVLRLRDKIRTIDIVDRRTAALQDTFTQIRTPPQEKIKALSAHGDALAEQADSSNGAALKGVRDQFDTLAWLFKQTAAILLPLSQEGVLLDQYRRNLSSWRDNAKSQYFDALKALGVRLAILLALLAIVFVAAEAWRRGVLRYVHEPRRRFQLLLVRRIVFWALVVAIVGFTFATDLGSLATFAGLLTAGVAVAMQSVLVSIVGYFFLIGKYGIRVGDRVQIGSVTGEVIDLGLVRLHLMELSGQGPLGPTGRVVAFANSIVFQASGGIFNQIPAVNLAWQDMKLQLPPKADPSAMKEKLLAAANQVLSEYSEDMARQTREIQKTTSLHAGGEAQAQVQLRFSASGVEALVRYPVQLQRAAEIDERISRELLKVITDTAA